MQDKLFYFRYTRDTCTVRTHYAGFIYYMQDCNKTFYITKVKPSLHNLHFPFTLFHKLNANTYHVTYAITSSISKYEDAHV